MARFDDQAHLHELRKVMIESGRLCPDQARQLLGGQRSGGDEAIDDLQPSLRDQAAQLFPLHTQ